MPQVRERVQQELEDKKDEKMPLQLDHRISFGEVVLKPGLYQLVFLQRQDNSGFLYFFGGKKVKTKKVRLAVPVEVLSRSDGNISSQVIYREPRQELTSFISEIRVGERVFRFPEIKPVHAH